MRTRKLSVLWFIAIHLSAPAIWALRATTQVNLWYVPLFVALAVAGQLLGGWLFPPAGTRTSS